MWFSNSFWNTTLLRLSKWYPSPPKKNKTTGQAISKQLEITIRLYLYMFGKLTWFVITVSNPNSKIYSYFGDHHPSSSNGLMIEHKNLYSWMIPTRSWSMSAYSLYPHDLRHSISTKYSHVSRKLLNTPHVCWFMSNTDCCFVSHKPRIASHWEHQTAPLHRSRCPFFQLQPLFGTLWPIFVRTFRVFPKMVVPQ